MMEQVDLLDLAKEIVRLQKDIYSELTMRAFFIRLSNCYPSGIISDC
jgi:hypothetical protein